MEEKELMELKEENKKEEMEMQIQVSNGYRLASFSLLQHQLV